LVAVVAFVPVAIFILPIRRRNLAVLASLLLLIVAAAIGCGGNGAKAPVGIPAGTYSVEVSVSSSGVSGSTNVTVMVH
jgi:hypothetical protein